MPTPSLPATADAVIIGAGVVGAACAYFAARAGVRVAVLDRGAVAGGTTGTGGGNLSVSDKHPGPELDLALRSLSLWRDISSTLDADAIGADAIGADAIGVDAIELAGKGGLAVAATTAGADALRTLAARQRTAGVDVVDLAPAQLHSYEPLLAEGLAGGAFYAQDMQVQPMLATAYLLRAAARHAATFHPGTAATGVERAADGRVVAVHTTSGRVVTPAIVNAAGTGARAVAALAGVGLPILVRHGFVLVTQPLTVAIRHTVCAIAASEDAAGDSTTTAVIEGTRSGTVLIGSSCERTGVDDGFALPVLRRLATQAVGLLPFLAGVHTIRPYRGLRPCAPDHLPMIGPDPRVPGLLHACGHGDSGIGLAPATADLVTASLTGTKAAVDTTPFRPDRFDRGNELACVT